jgi:hypothetical protein
MEPLVLEYVLSGGQRGYNFTSPTRPYDEETLKRIWRGAMPRGQGWGGDAYSGARSIKCFPLDERRMALSTVTVTDQRDESGRKGIRRAVIQVMSAEACAMQLRTHLRGYPYAVEREIERLPTPAQWAKLVGRVVPMLGKPEQQIVLTRDYATGDWQVMEGVIIKLALALTTVWKRGSPLVPFTTLALDPREEMALVGVPSGALKDDVDKGRVLKL